jgi:hypothetical protein
MWSLVERAGAPRVEVRCVTLDQLFAQRSCGIPALIKIDAEGAELDIIRGGARIVAETNAMLVVEFTNAQGVEEARSLLPHHHFRPLSNSHWLLRRTA